MPTKIRKRTSEKKSILAKRQMRVRKKVSGTPERPRMCVTKTLRGVFIQLIDDDKGVTLIGLRTPFKKTANKELCKKAGMDVASMAQSKGIKHVVFDRSGNLYHGRVAAVAAGAREGGLQF